MLQLIVDVLQCGLIISLILDYDKINKRINKILENTTISTGLTSKAIQEIAKAIIEILKNPKDYLPRN